MSEDEAIITDKEQRINQLDQKLTEIEKRIEAHSIAIQNIEDELNDEQDYRQDLKSQIEGVNEQIQEINSSIEDLDSRTDMLEIVEASDEMDGEQRSTALIQHLQNKAQQHQEKDRSPKAAVDRNEAEEALHYPDVDRTTIYDDMKRAARHTGSDDVLYYVDGELELDLTNGKLDEV